MIQFALLFGLGFLTALLIALLVAPAIHRRVVIYTENRLRATMPISPQEVRAQRDMARAVYAAENARTKQELVQERDKALALQLRGEALRNEVKKLVADNLLIKTELDRMDTAAADLRARVRQEESIVVDLRAAVEAAEAEATEKDSEIEALRQEIEVLAANNDNARIDLSTRETEIENLKFRIGALREERDGLREEVRALTVRSKDAEARLAHEESRALRAEEKVAKEIATRTDLEQSLERRQREIERLNQKLIGMSALPATAAQQPAALALDMAEAQDGPMSTEEITDGDDAGPALPPLALNGGQPRYPEVEAEIAELGSEARLRATALTERLLNSRGTANDEALREEIAEIAARMTAMTALAEGPRSPVRPMIAGKAGGDRLSLAKRVRTLLAADDAAVR